LANHPPYFPSRDNALLWTLALSIALHALAIWQLPSIKIEKEPPEPTLIVEIAPPKKVEPPPVEMPESPAEQPPKPTPPKPQLKPEPIVKAKPSPSPIAEPPPSNTPEPVAQPAPPAVIAAAPKADAQPVFTAPPPEPSKPAVPSQQDVDTDSRPYGILLGKAIAKQKQYPRIATIRGWQGDVTLELKLDGNGNLLSSKVHESSTFEVLDKQALEMVKKALPFPPPPDALRGHSFTILVPVSFRLE
jgi:protein TonB